MKAEVKRSEGKSEEKRRQKRRQVKAEVKRSDRGKCRKVKLEEKRSEAGVAPFPDGECYSHNERSQAQHDAFAAQRRSDRPQHGVLMAITLPPGRPGRLAKSRSDRPQHGVLMAITLPPLGGLNTMCICPITLIMFTSRSIRSQPHFSVPLAALRKIFILAAFIDCPVFWRWPSSLRNSASSIILSTKYLMICQPFIPMILFGS